MIVLALLGGAYYFGKLPVKSSIPQSQISVSPFPKSTQANETANPDSNSGQLKTFTDNNLSFKYPSNATVTNYNDEVILQYTEPNSPDGVELPVGYIVSLKYGKLQSQSLQQLALKRVKEDESKNAILANPLREIKVGEYSGYRYTKLTQITTEVYFLSNGKDSYVEINQNINDSNNKDYQTQINNILSTFQFTP